MSQNRTNIATLYTILYSITTNRPCINFIRQNLSVTMKIAILVLALVAVACAALITGSIEEQVENRLKRLQQELEITKEEMDESEVAIQAVDEVQKYLEQMKDSSSRCLKASYYEHGVYTSELAIFLERHAAQCMDIILIVNAHFRNDDALY